MKGKSVLSANHVVIVFSIKLERTCKHEGSRKVLWLKQRYFMSFADKTFLIIINTERAKQARKDLQFSTASIIFGPKSRKVGLIVKFYKPFSQ